MPNDETPTHETDFWRAANDATEISALRGALDGARDVIKTRDARIASLEQEVSRTSSELARSLALLKVALELISEYECQWGDDYLAQRWGLKEQHEAIKQTIRQSYPEETPTTSCDLCNGARTLTREGQIFWCDRCRGTGTTPPLAEHAFGPPPGRVGRFYARYSNMEQRVELNLPSHDPCSCCQVDHSQVDHKHQGGGCGARPARNFMLSGWVDALVLCEHCIPKTLSQDAPQNQGAT